jgi:hypothetical protein
LQQKTWGYNLRYGARRLDEAFIDPIRALEDATLDVCTGGSLLFNVMLKSEPPISFSAVAIEFARSLAFYTTEKRHFGMAPDSMSETVKKGDCIAVLAGLKLPVILRRKLDGTFAFVTHCYYHGAMQGEALQGVHEDEDLEVIVLA